MASVFNGADIINILASIIALAIGLIASTLVASEIDRTWATSKKAAEKPTLESRANALMKSLSDSIDLLNEFTKEIKTREIRASQLAQEIANNTKLAQMSREQADAVKSAIQDELEGERSRSRRDTFLIGFLFFLLGVAVTLGIPTITRLL